MFRLIAKTRLAPRKAAYGRFRPVRVRFYRELWRRTAERLGVEFEVLSDDVYRIKKNQSATFLFRGEARFDDPVMYKIAGDKPLLYKIYEEHGIFAPRHVLYNRSSLEKAQKFLEGLGAAAVVKPARDSGGGEGVTMNVTDQRTLLTASQFASNFCDGLLIEEQLEGRSYRLLFLNGELIDAVRRDPPTLAGDGHATVRELIRRENNCRISGGEITALSPLTVDLDMRQTLRGQGLSMKSVPEREAPFRIKSVANENAASQNHPVINAIHTATIKMAQRLVRSLNIQLAGVDIICRDIGAPLGGDNGALSEINTGPGIHHHYLTTKSGAPNFVADRIIECLLARHV